MARFVHPNKELLNVNFQGYKLAEEPLELIQSELPCPVSAVKLKEGEFSYQHTKVQALHNHLHSDPSDPSSVYWCARDGSIRKTSLSEAGSLSVQTVLTLPPMTSSSAEERANVTMEFISTHMGVVCAGGNEVAVFSRDKRNGSEKWTILKSFTTSEGTPTMLVCACLGAAGKYTDILCAELSNTTTTRNWRETSVTYKWLRVGFKINPMLTQPSSEDVGDFSVVAAFQSKSLALYTAFQHHPSSAEQQLLFGCETTPLFSPTPTGPEKEDQGVAGNMEQDKNLFDESVLHRGLDYKEEDYQWTQSETDVAIQFHLPPEIHKRDISCVISAEELVVGFSDGTTLLRGDLVHTIDPDASTWTIQSDILEVTLEKAVEGVEWKRIVKDHSAEDRPHLPFSEGLDDLSAEDLLKVMRTLETQQQELGSVPRRAGPILQTPLEDCDTSEGNVIMFVISEQCKLKQRVDFGGCQFVFKAASPNRHPGYFSLRHDVDAVVWLPHAAVTSSQSRWTHISTFNALGYVQASKSERKFTTCSPNLKYAVISNSTHVFVYMQPKEQLNSALEYVYSASRQANILGLVVTDVGSIFVLTNNQLNVLRIPHF